jgi:hypothetical protein
MIGGSSIDPRDDHGAMRGKIQSSILPDLRIVPAILHFAKRCQGNVSFAIPALRERRLS